MSPSTTVEQRLDRLERQNRRLKVVLCVLAAAAGGAIALRSPLGIATRRARAQEAGPEAPKVQTAEVLRARAVEVVGADGKVVARLAAEGGYGYLATYAPSGEPLVTLASAPRSHAGIIQTHNAKGKALAAVTATDNGDGAVVTYGRGGKRLVQVFAGEQGDGMIETCNRKGQRLMLLTSTGGVCGSLAAFNDQGKVILLTNANERGDGVLSVCDAKGTSLADITAGAAGNAMLNLSSSNGKPFLTITTDDRGQAAVLSRTPTGGVKAHWP